MNNKKDTVHVIPEYSDIIHIFDDSYNGDLLDSFIVKELNELVNGHIIIEITDSNLILDVDFEWYITTDIKSDFSNIKFLALSNQREDGVNPNGKWVTIHLVQYTLLSKQGIEKLCISDLYMVLVLIMLMKTQTLKWLSRWMSW